MMDDGHGRSFCPLSLDALKILLVVYLKMQLAANAIVAMAIFRRSFSGSPLVI